jgi:LCP family protein required for cell wall assembly
MAVAGSSVGVFGALAWHAVHERNESVPAAARRVLSTAKGSPRSSERIVLLVGSDSSDVRDEQTANRAPTTDSLLLLRIDPDDDGIDMLSIPRDLLVTLPGHGPGKIGAAYAIGGLPLVIRTVQRELDVEVNHVVFIDFDGFRDVIDSLGGVTIDNPHAIRTAVPFDDRRWEFRVGRQHLDGRAALAYARLRRVDDTTIAANPDEAQELGRSFRQQRVIDAVLDKLTLRRLVANPIALPRDVLRPVTTDIGADTLLAWGARGIASHAGAGLRCRLGGMIVPRDGDQALLPVPLNDAVVASFLGEGSVPPPINATAGGCVDVQR